MMTLFSVSMFATSITMPATALDLQSPTMVTTAGWTGEKAYYLDDDVLVVSGYESYKSVAKQTWITFLSTGSSDNTWDALAPFKGSSYYTSAKYATLQAGRYTAYLVKGCDSVWVYGYNNGATKYLTMKIYDVTGSEATSIDDTSVDPTYAVDNSAVGKANGVMKQALNSEKTYLIVTSGTGNGNSRVFEVAFFRHPSSTPTPDPDPTTRTLYCKVAQSWWKADGAAVGIYAFKGEEHNAAWPGERMTLAENETEVWTATIDAKYEKVIFVRVNGSGDISDWGAKTADLTLADAGENDLYTVTSSTAVWGDPGVTGEWSKYSPSEPPAPAEPDSIYFVNVPGWENLRVHLWGGTAAGTTWPGVEMTKLGEDDKINGYDVYKYVALEGAYTQCIFSNNGENKTVDLNWTSGKYYYDGAWYAKADIPEPIPAAVPLEGNIWKVTDKTPVRAGSHYIDEALLKVDGVYATTLKPNTRTIAGEEFTYAIQVRTDGYPTQDVLAGKEKTGSTSLIITAKENADITLYYNRQAIDATGTENDNKDLIVFDQAAIATKLTGVFTVVEVLEGNNYLNATKKLALKKGHVYTVTASGTTLQLHGIKLEEHIPSMQIAGGWNVKDEAWVVNNMTLAGDAKTATYEVELSKGDYEFKVLKDGAWLTKANDGAYGLHREWPGVAGVTDDAANNLKITADAAGKYIFTWTFANDSIGITFPAPEPTKYFLKNNWDGAETWTWKEMTNDDGSYILAEVVFGGTGVNINTVESDEGTSWIDAKDIEAFDLSYEPATLGALDTVVFFFDPEAVNTYTGENGLSALILGKYVAPVPEPVLEDGFYLIGKIGGVDGWNVADLKAEQKFAPNLENPVEFMLNVTLAEGDEIKVVNVLSDVITAWFPGDGSSNFVVTAAYAGEKTVYFRPDQQGGEGWHYGCIYIAPNQGTGISNTAVEGKAVKMIMGDQLLIIRNGKTYNVQGQQLK